MTRKCSLTWISIWFFWLALPLSVPAGTPLNTVEGNVNRVLEVLRDPKLKGEDSKSIKEKRIWAIGEDLFDYTELSRRTLGRNWRKLSPDQKKEFVELFSRLLGTVYMDRIVTYTDEKVVFEKERMMSDTKAEVKSKVITKSGEIPIFYRMIKKNGTWKVYDVIVEGVSLIKNYRSQFRRILKNKSPEDMLGILRKKVKGAHFL